MSSIGILVKAATVGIGGTLVLDLYALFLARVMGVPVTNWAMVGRWFGNMPRGQFVQTGMSKAEPVKGELAIGWIAHYAIGAGYGLLLLPLWGRVWLNHPTVLPPIFLSWVLLIAPCLVMMPGMGLGIAGRRAPRPNITRLKSMVGHSVFGFGMYATAVALSRLWPTVV